MLTPPQLSGNLFKRRNSTYTIHKNLLSGIVADEASPLLRIAKLLPEGSVVLDAGAGNGIFADVAQKLNLNITLDGLEPNKAATEIAGGKYRRFYQAPLEELAESKACMNHYDALVLADVIEHTQDPEDFLQTAKRLLAPQGKLYLSVPNVAFAAVRASLLCGEWKYTDWGLLERTHLRFFTKRTMLELAASLSLQVERIEFLRRNPFDMDIRLHSLRLNHSTLRAIAKDELSQVYQFVFVLTPNGSGATQEKWHGTFPRNIVWNYLKLRWRQL